MGNPLGVSWLAPSPMRVKDGDTKSERGKLALSALAPCHNQCTIDEVRSEGEDGRRRAR
jgi:hypothetical protein